MSEKRSTPPWLKKLIELGNPQKQHSDSKGRPYRTSTYRYFWGLLAIFLYFLLSAYRLGGGEGSTDNFGIFALIIGALIAGGLGAFFAPRLNELLERLTPSGRRNKEDQIRRQSRRSDSRYSGRRSRSQEESSSRSRSSSQKSES